MDIVNSNLLFLFEWNGVRIYITESMRTLWIVSALMIAFAVIVRVKLKKFKEIPSGFQNAVEALVEMMGGVTKGALGEKLEFLGPYFFGVFIFILVSNYIGLVPGLRPPTSDLATTMPLAIMSFILIHFCGMKMRKGSYFKEYLSPFPLFLPLNILGELARPLSLGLRLFGNILGGLIIIQVMYTMLPTAARFVLPNVGHALFDLFAGFLQAFVFIMLSMTFIRVKSSESE